MGFLTERSPSGAVDSTYTSSSSKRVFSSASSNAKWTFSRRALSLGAKTMIPTPPPSDSTFGRGEAGGKPGVLFKSTDLVLQRVDSLRHQVSGELAEVKRLMVVLGTAVGAVHKDLHHFFSTSGPREGALFNKMEVTPFFRDVAGVGKDTGVNYFEEVTYTPESNCTCESESAVQKHACNRGLQTIGHDDPAMWPILGDPFIANSFGDEPQPPSLPQNVSVPEQSTAEDGTPRMSYGSVAVHSHSFGSVITPATVGKRRTTINSKFQDVSNTHRRGVVRDFHGLRLHALTSRTESADEIEMQEARTDTGSEADLRPTRFTAAPTVAARVAFRHVLDKLPLWDPDSTERHFWDTCGFCILLCECVYIPVALAWQLPESELLSAAMWFTTAFWILDLLLRFNTGFYRNGELEVRRSVIACRYLQKTFIFDMAATGFDLITFLFSESDLRRQLRLLRFLRLSTMWTRLGKLHGLFLSDAWRYFVQLLMMLLSIALVNHFVCCAWYYIGEKSFQDTGRGWLEIEEQIKGTKVTYRQFSEVFQYVTSYHWSVAQMFVGSTQITAHNSAERIFNIVINLFGMFFTAVITGWLSALWVQHHQSQNDVQIAIQNVRRYLRQNRLHLQTERSILKQLRIRLMAKKYVSEADAPALQLLSKPLKSKMRLEIWKPALLKCPGMFLVHSADSSILQQLCWKLQCKSWLAGDEIFHPNSKLDMASVNVRGELTYTLCSPRARGADDADDVTCVSSILQSGEIKRPEGVVTVCGEGVWIAEALLWTDSWTTQGHMHCHTIFAEVVGVRPKHFKATLKHSGERRTRFLVKAYASAYRDIFREVPAYLFSDIEPPVDHAMVVMAMNCHDRLLACQPVLEHLSAKDRGLFHFHQGRHLKGASVLEQEIRNGECGLVFNTQEHPVRIAFATVLRILRSDGLILYHVAKVTDGRVTPKLQMPATKLKQGETALQAAQRILNDNLAQFGADHEIGACARDRSVRDTPNYGIHTCFYRTTYNVMFKETSTTPLVINLEERRFSHKTTISAGLLAFSTRNEPRRSKPSTFTQSQLPGKVFFVKVGAAGDGVIYAWMSPAAFDELQHNSPLFHEWLSAIPLPQEGGSSTRHKWRIRSETFNTFGAM